MSLVSIIYRINQHSAKLCQFETTDHGNAPKPIFLRHLRTVGGLRRRWRTSRRFRRRSPELKGNELSLVGTTEHRTGKKPPQKNASAAKSESCRQRDRSHDNAQQ